MTVLDASAVLALIHDEAGSDVVATHIAGAVLGAANLAEVVGKLVDAEIDVARLRGLLAAASTSTTPASTTVREQVDVRAGRSVLSDLFQQSAQDGVAQPAPLVLGKDRHVDDVEVPAPVTEQAPHADYLASALAHDVAGRPTAAQRSCGLLLGLRRQPCLLP